MNRLLVVDDDAASVEGLQRLLQLDGYEVVATASSIEALELLKQHRFDALVTDLEMPEVHGIEVVRAAHGMNPKLPIVVITAYTESPATRAALHAGARCILDKPLEYERLVETLGREIGVT